MAITLVEAAKYSQNDLQRGVIETIVDRSPLLQMIPFIETSGNAYAWDLELTMPAATFYAVGDTWTEATPTVEQKTAALKILGGDADVDKFILQTNPGDAANIKAEVLASRAKSVRHVFMDSFINGDSALNPKAFDGLTKVLSATPAQEVSMGTDGGSIGSTDALRHDFLDKLDQAIALVNGEVSTLIMSDTMRMRFRGLARRLSIYDETRDAFGQYVQSYAGIPITASRFVSNTQVQGTSGSVCTSIYAVRLGRSAEDGAVSGLTNGGIQVSELGELETKQAERTRISWYCGSVVHNVQAVSRVRGILPS